MAWGGREVVVVVVGAADADADAAADDAVAGWLWLVDCGEPLLVLLLLLSGRWGLGPWRLEVEKQQP